MTSTQSKVAGGCVGTWSFALLFGCLFILHGHTNSVALDIGMCIYIYYIHTYIDNYTYIYICMYRIHIAIYIYINTYVYILAPWANRSLRQVMVTFIYVWSLATKVVIAGWLHNCLWQRSPVGRGLPTYFFAKEKPYLLAMFKSHFIDSTWLNHCFVIIPTRKTARPWQSPPGFWSGSDPIRWKSKRTRWLRSTPVLVENDRANDSHLIEV